MLWNHTCGRVLDGELHAQRFQKLIYLKSLWITKLLFQWVMYQALSSEMQLCQLQNVLPLSKLYNDHYSLKSRPLQYPHASRDNPHLSLCMIAISPLTGSVRNLHVSFLEI